MIAKWVTLKENAKTQASYFEQYAFRFTFVFDFLQDVPSGIHGFEARAPPGVGFCVWEGRGVEDSGKRQIYLAS